MNNCNSVPEATIENPSQNLYLLVRDLTGNPVGLMLTSFPASFLHSLTVPGLEADGSRVPNRTQFGQGLTQSTANQVLLPLVESALKRFYDLVYLSEHPLTQLRIVQAVQHPEMMPKTRLEHGKAVHALLTQAIERLRPHGPVPGRTVIPERMWQPYLILHTAYVEDEPNARIMGWLQISEGTFNRTRRRALQAVAQVLAEMEGCEIELMAW